MNEDYKPNNTPDLIPFLTVKNMLKSIEFYEKAFGFKIYGEVARDEDGAPIHVEMRRLGASIMFSPEGAYGMKEKAPITTNVESGIGLYIYCENVDALYEQAIKNGALGLLAPEDTFWGDRMCRMADINNYRFAFATKIK